ncbi:nuclear transport factor 2 family protein [Kinneretia aquatilis]|nr:nuclear transport factor 2 family protein [Paucibacter aquatile]
MNTHADLSALILRLEAERTQALVRKDMATAERLHAPDYQLITPGGRCMDKAGYLRAVAEGRLNYRAWQIEAPQLQLSDTLVLLRYEALLSFPERQLRCWHSDLYALHQGQWLALRSQATAFPPEAAAATPLTAG